MQTFRIHGSGLGCKRRGAAVKTTTGKRFEIAA